ncbi:MAG: ABC transporter ATP-binding protein, partial [Acidimicrobiales bacterium]
MTTALGRPRRRSAVPAASRRPEPDPAPARAVLDHLSYTYPAWSDRPAPALSGVDLELGPGMTLLAGDSGAGKSTLLRVLNGLVPHFHGGHIAGRATVAGLDVLSTPTRQLARHVGFVFQDPEVGFVRGTVAREVAFGLENLGLPAGQIHVQVGEALEAVGIPFLAGRRLSTLSGGEAQRVALAAALAGAPELIVLDEPTSQLDDPGAAALAAVLGRLASAGHAVVVAEHRLGRLGTASRVVVVVAGGTVVPAPGVVAPAGVGPCFAGGAGAGGGGEALAGA